jgi:hypothetical protein
MGELRVKVTGNSTGFQQTLNGLKAQAKAFSHGVSEEVGTSFSRGLTGAFAGMFTFEALKGALEGFISRASGIKDVSEQLDMAADATQRWDKAADKLNLTFGGMQQVLTSIQSKRTEALKDPKAADIFEMMGIKRSDVLNADQSDFAKMVLEVGLKSDENRRLLEQVIGKRGLKYAPAAQYLNEVTPDFNSDALEIASKAEHAEKEVSSKLGKVMGYLAIGVRDVLNTGTTLSDALWGNVGDGKKAKLVTLDSGASGAIGNIATAAKPDKDPLTAALALEQKDFDLQKQEAEMQLNSAKRRNMTIGDRRDAIKQELATVQKQIAEREAALTNGTFLTADEKELLTPSEQLKRKRDYELKTIGLKGKAEGLISDLKEKPLNFSADNLAKVGLYSASSIAFNPVLGIQQQQLNVLHRIAHNTGIHSDPHSP